MTLRFRVRYSLLALAVLSLVIVLPTPALAGDQVPLKGRFEGLGNDFSGQMSHLGNFTGVFDPGTSTAVWTAANGDTVTNQTTEFQLVEWLGSNRYRYEQTLEITGGTGRFADAKGSATVYGLIDLGTGAYDGRLEGSISRVGRGKG